MLIRKIWRSRLVILCCGFLLFTTGCGLSEMFGGSGAEKITEPCIELIPLTTPTPAPVITVTPAPENTPQPGDTPTPPEACGDAPGIVLICDGEPVDDTPITVITPPPTPIPIISHQSYTIQVALTYDPFNPACLGTTMTPPGPLLNVSAGTIQQFIVATNSTCDNVDVFQSPPGSLLFTAFGFPSVTVNVGPVNQNLFISLYVY